jgi:hypothetical protein
LNQTFVPLPPHKRVNLSLACSSQAIPLAGSFTGASGAFLGMDVEVEIRAERVQSND